MPRLRVGLLGGSFNPPHGGHLQLSLAALKDGQLDQVWWLVSPQNPLKSPKGLLPQQKRMELAVNLIKHPRIKAVDIEKRLPNTYSITTVRFLKRKYPQITFIWMMGADNLLQFHRWKSWKELFHMLPILVYDRGNYRYKALASRAARYFKDARQPYQEPLCCKPPAWSLIINKKNPLSSTIIRESGCTLEVNSLLNDKKSSNYT